MTAKKQDKEKDSGEALNTKSIEALRASNELFSLFMRHSPVCAYIKAVTPTESRILQASDDYQKMLGSSSLDIVGKTMAELFPAEFAAKMTADDWAVVTNGNVLQMEKDLDDRSYISIKFPFVQGDKNMLAGYMFDVTERKMAEESLKKSGQLLKEAQEAAHTSNIAERKMAEESLREVEEKLRAGEETLREVEGKLRAGKEKLQAVEGKLQAVEGKPQEVEGKLQAVEGKLREEEGRLRKEEEKLQAVEGKLREGEGKLRAGDDKLRAGEKKLREVEGKLQAVEGKLRAGDDKLRAGEKKLREVEEKLRKEEEKLQGVEGKPREVEGKLREGEEKLRKGEEKLREGEEKLRKGEEKLRAGNEKLQEIEGKLRKEEEKLQEIEIKLRAGEEKLRKGEEKPREVDGKLRAGEEKLRKGEEKLREVEGKLREEEEKLQGVEEKMQEVEGKLREGEEKLQEIEIKLRAEDTTPASLEEKELLREVHNNVKNNMSSIITLIEMQRKMPGKLLAKPALTNSDLSALESRIGSIALVHEHLYRSQNPSRIDFQDYLSALVAHLRTSLDAPPELVCSVDANGITFNLNTAVPVGMIVNELVTNILKYAFPGNRPQYGTDQCKIMISLERKDAEYTLIVEDNGIGLPKSSSLAKKSTLGLRLVKMLGVDHLGGKLTLNRTQGTRFILKFNVKQ